ncbi:MAG: hypothetical protein MJ252_22780 [archaeon]|nr:hypothetical protein [archaeon]
MEYENSSLAKLLAYNRKKLEYEDLNHQYEITKESYNDAARRNTELKADCDSRTIEISTLETEIEDMKQVIAKLTDARVILNKYFDTHFENFSEQEKNLIKEVEGNVFPGYYNNSPVLPDINQANLMKAQDNAFFVNTTSAGNVQNTSQGNIRMNSSRPMDQPKNTTVNSRYGNEQTTKNVQPILNE